MDRRLGAAHMLAHPRRAPARVAPSSSIGGPEIVLTPDEQREEAALMRVNGGERRSERLVGEFGPEALLQRLSQEDRS